MASSRVCLVAVASILALLTELGSCLPTGTASLLATDSVDKSDPKLPLVGAVPDHDDHHLPILPKATTGVLDHGDVLHEGGHGVGADGKIAAAHRGAAAFPDTSSKEPGREKDDQKKPTTAGQQVSHDAADADADADAGAGGAGIRGGETASIDDASEQVRAFGDAAADAIIGLLKLRFVRDTAAQNSNDTRNETVVAKAAARQADDDDDDEDDDEDGDSDEQDKADDARDDAADAARSDDDDDDDSGEDDSSDSDYTIQRDPPRTVVEVDRKSRSAPDDKDGGRKDAEVVAGNGEEDGLIVGHKKHSSSKKINAKPAPNGEHQQPPTSPITKP